jgi:hypothetical protein
MVGTMVLRKKNFEKNNTKKTPFPSVLLVKETLLICNYPKDDL